MTHRRKALFEILDQFCKETITAEMMNYKIISLLKEGDVREELSDMERKAFNNFTTWYADMYQQDKQPRSGLVGHLKDIWAQIFHGEYRVSLADLKKKARELVNMLA